MSVRALDLVLRVISSQENSRAFERVAKGAKSTAVEVERVGDEADKAGDKLASIGDKGALEKTKQNARSVREDLSRLGKDAEHTKDTMEGVEKAGTKIGLAGAGALLFANYLSRVADEGAGAEQRLKAVFVAQSRLSELPAAKSAIDDIRTRGHWNDDDPIIQSTSLLANWEVKMRDIPGLLEAAARQSQLTGQSIEELSNSFGKSVSTGNYEGLKRSAVSFSDLEVAAIKAGYAVSQEAGQLALVNSIMAAVARTTGELGSGLTESQKAANDAAFALDNLQTNLGVGVQQGEENIRALTSRILELANASPEAAQGVGRIGYYASLGAIGFGSLLNAGSQTFAGLISVAQYYGTTIGGLLSPAFWAARWASFAAMGSAAWSSILASVTATTAGFNLATAGVAAVGIAIGVAMGAGYYKILQLTGGLREQKTYLDSLSDGWAAFKDIFTGDNAANRGVNAREIAAEISSVKEKNSQAVLAGTMSQADADKDNAAREIAIREKWAKSQFANGESADATKNQEAAARLRQQQSIGTTPAPYLPPVAAANIPITGGPTATSSPTAAGAIAMSTTSAPPVAASDVLNQQIRQLQDEAANANKARKAVIAGEIRELRRQQQDAKKAEAEAKRASKVGNRDDLDLAKAKSDIAAAKQIDSLTDQLDAAKEAGNAAEVGRITTQIEMAKAKKVLEDKLAAAAQEEAGKHRDTLIKIAQLEYQADTEKAGTAGDKASNSTKQTKTGNQDFSRMMSYSGPQHFGYGNPDRLINALRPGGNQSEASSRELSRTTKQNSDGSYKTVLQVEVSTPYQGVAGLD